MLLTLPECGEVVFLAPHPDDEALGCAGTLTLLNRKGVSSTVVFLTNGEKIQGEPSTVIAEKRKEEARRASKMLGCREPVFLGFPDGEVGDHRDALSKHIADIIAVKKPDIVFAPSPIDFHQDHMATAKISLELLSKLDSFKLAFYEVYSTIRFTHLIDITEVVEQKKEVILNYRTSLYGRPGIYVHVSLGLNAHRSFFTQEKKYYEAFWILEQPFNRQEITNWLSFGFSIT
ncbi:MAG: PIG-L family deacetylase [Thermodesulfovibrionales bacterium]|jgi:LmbE family N-acetylglucosaminyl deacetylase